MSKLKKTLPFLAVLLVVAGSIGVYALTQNDGSSKVADTSTQTKMSTAEKSEATAVENEQATPQQEAQASDSQSAGVYKAYSQQAVADNGYTRTLVFFHAPWCPQCREFEKNIKASASQIPTGTQILKTDYDSSTKLKEKYGVTLQTTFVRVDKSGNAQKKWVGYTSDHSLNTLLQQFKD